MDEAIIEGEVMALILRLAAAHCAPSGAGRARLAAIALARRRGISFAAIGAALGCGASAAWRGADRAAALARRDATFERDILFIAADLTLALLRAVGMAFAGAAA